MLILVQISINTRTDAETLARLIIQNRLAACVQIHPIYSIYSWENEIQGEDEYLLQIKTSSEKFTELEAFVLQNHPYEVPEIIGVPISLFHQPYADWVNLQTTAWNAPR